MYEILCNTNLLVYCCGIPQQKMVHETNHHRKLMISKFEPLE